METKDKKEIIGKTVEFVREKLEKDITGHDWWHVYRVWKNAILIGKKENVDLFIIELAALLHDIADWKFNNRKSDAGSQQARAWLLKMEVKEEIISHICEIIENMSFKGLDVKFKLKTKEGKVVQDADRLDAIGAIGIARVFAYHSGRQRLIYNPEIDINKRVMDMRKGDSYSSIHHFYDKLLHVKGLINTKTGKEMARERHQFILIFLKQFFREWCGK